MKCETCPNRKIVTNEYCKYFSKCRRDKDFERTDDYYSAMYSGGIKNEQRRDQRSVPQREP